MMLKMNVRAWLALLLGPLSAIAQPQSSTLKGQPFNNITLEVSLKPFRKNDQAYIRETAREMFVQWHSLLRHADTVSVMLWTGDGSEILEYKGEPGQRLEWARYIGNPNTDHAVNSGPKELSIHERAYLYLDNPPEFTYGDLKFIVATLNRQITRTLAPGSWQHSAYSSDRHSKQSNAFKPDICAL